MSGETVMHMDGCHFYVWVWRDEQGAHLSFAERQSDDLYLHSRPQSRDEEPCDHCAALRAGAVPRDVRRDIGELPEDSKETFFLVAGIVGEIDEDLSPTEGAG